LFQYPGRLGDIGSQTGARPLTTNAECRYRVVMAAVRHVMVVPYAGRPVLPEQKKLECDIHGLMESIRLVGRMWRPSLRGRKTDKR
jgi:hypothetical protein